MPTVRRGSAVPYHPPTPRCLPEHMWVTCPEMPEAAGRFTLLMEKRNEMPAWKGGKRYLYCNVGGGWMLASDYEHMQSNRGWIASARPHNGLLPHEHTAWESADGIGGWQAMATVSIAAEPPAFPPTVAVRAPTHGEVCGVYTLLAGVYHNGFPVWGSGEKRLYSGEGGWWLVDPDKRHVELDRGLLASAAKHGGVSPAAVPSWEVADGVGGWVKDPRCTVTAVADNTAAAHPPRGSVPRLPSVQTRDHSLARSSSRCSFPHPPHPPSSNSNITTTGHPSAPLHTSPNTASASPPPQAAFHLQPSVPPSHRSFALPDIAGLPPLEAVKTLAFELETVGKTLDDKIDVIHSLERELRVEAEHSAMLSREVEDSKQQMQDVRTARDMLQSEFDASELKSGRLRCEMLDMKGKVRALEDSLKAATAGKDALGKQLEHLAAADERAGAAAAKCSDVAAELEACKKESADVIAGLREDCAAKAQALDEAQRAGKRAKEETETINALCSSLKTEIQTRTQALSLAKEQLASSKAHSRGLEETAKAQRSALSAAVDGGEAAQRGLIESAWDDWHALFSACERRCGEALAIASAGAVKKEEEEAAYIAKLHRTCEENGQRAAQAERALAAERDARRQMFESARKAAEATVQAAANSLLSLINEPDPTVVGTAVFNSGGGGKKKGNPNTHNNNNNNNNGSSNVGSYPFAPLKENIFSPGTRRSKRALAGWTPLYP